MKSIYNSLSYVILKTLSNNKNKKSDIEIFESIDHDTFNARIPMIHLKHINKYLNYKNKSILDIGCGTGDFAILLAKTGAKKVVGVDINRVHIDAANKKAKQENVDSIVSFICADFNNFQPKELFDIAFSLSAFEHIQSPLNCLKQIYNCLAHGGILFTIFGPLWFSPYGAHLTGLTKIPWVHFIFPEKVVLKVRKEYYRPDEQVSTYEDVRGHLNRITVKKILLFTKQAGFIIQSTRINPGQDQGKYKFANMIINRIHFLRELFSFEMLSLLKKP